ncbi:MAG: DinB family protein [Lapillicoccus sp.]
MSPSHAQTLPDMWLDPEDDPRASGEIEVVDERTNLQEYLRVYRITLRMKCDGLTPEQLAARSVPPSTMSLLGLVRHMAKVERDWFRLRGAREDAPRLYWSEQDRDEAFSDAAPDQSVVDEAFARWDEEVAFSDRFVAAEPDLGRVFTYRDGESISLRELLLHMVEEYARHCGHADLLRECVDGRTGQ